MAFLKFLIPIKSKAATSVCMKTSHSSSGLLEPEPQTRSHEPEAEYPVIFLHVHAIIVFTGTNPDVTA